MENLSFAEAILKFITTLFNLILTAFGFAKKREVPSANAKTNESTSAAKADYLFVFNANKLSKGIIEPNLRRWYNNGQQETFDIKLVDDQEKVYKKRIKKLERKLTKAKNNPCLEKDLTRLSQEYKGFLSAIDLKQKACYFFLKDRGMQVYMGINSVVALQNYLYELIKIDYFEEKSRRSNNNDYIVMDLSIYPIPKVCNNYFLAPIKRDAITAVAHSMLDIPLLEIQDFGKDVLHEISIYYYYFLAEEVLIYRHTHIEEDANVMSLLKYQIGVH